MSIFALPLNKEKLYLGNYRPVNMYQGDRKIAGWTWAERQGTAVEFEDTYNDAVHGVISGHSEQVVTAQGKNLLDLSKYVPTSASLSISIISLEVNKLITTATNPHAYDYVEFDITALLLVGQTYCLSCKITSPFGSSLLIRYINDQGIPVFAPNGVVTPQQGKTYGLRFVVRNGPSHSGVYEAIADEIQLELGATATAYEPFTPNSPSPEYPSPIHSADGCDLKSKSADGSKSSSIALPPLRSLPNGVKDTLTYKGGGMWEHVQRVGVKVFDGTEENWKSQSDVRWYLSTSNGLNNAAASSATSGLCSHCAVMEGASSASITAGRVGWQTSGSIFFALYESFPSETLWRDFLAAQYAAGTPVTVQYQLATPITTLLNLGELKTYPHETQIHQDTTGIMADLTLTARVVDKEAE